MADDKDKVQELAQAQYDERLSDPTFATAGRLVPANPKPPWPRLSQEEAQKLFDDDPEIQAFRKAFEEATREKPDAPGSS